MNIEIIGLCHTCKRKHRMRGTYETIGDRVAEWRFRHPNHRVSIREPWEMRRDWTRYGDNADVKAATASQTALTITLASLATDANLLTGWESAAVDNSSNLYLGGWLSGKITTGTTPTVDKFIYVYSYAQVEDTPAYPDVFDGTNSAETVTSANIRDQILRLVAAMKVSASSDITYWFGPTWLPDLWGALPIRFGVFVTHNTGVNLNSTAGNHAIYFKPWFSTVI